MLRDRKHEFNAIGEVLLSGLLAGVVLVILDLVDFRLDGFGIGLGARDAAVVVAYGVVAMGGFGVLCYGLARMAWSTLDRMTDTSRIQRALPTIALALSILQAAACIYMRIGGRLRFAPLLLVPIALIAYVFVRTCEPALSRSAPQGRLANVMYLLAFAIAFVTGSRIVYGVARLTGQMMAWVHFVVIATLLVGLAAWLHARFAGKLEGRSGLILQGAVALVVLAPINMVQLGPDGKLVMLERTTLTFQVARAHPGTRMQSADTMPAELLATDGALECETERTIAPGSTEAASEAASINTSIVWILVDTLRPDRIEASNDGRPLMPVMSRFVQRAAHFEYAYAPATKTRYSVPAMLKGDFVASGWADSPSEEKHAFTHLLAANGVGTRAVLSHNDLKSTFEAFDLVDTTVAQEVDADRRAVTSEQVTDRAKHHLEELRGSGPFLLVVHYYDPHGRFVPHAGLHWWQLPVTLYDGEVANVDRWIGDLLLAVDEARRDGPVTVVVTSDHGDEFWEHRYARHVLRVYDESSRIVFLVDEGAAQKPVRFETPVSGMDVGPTILDLFGIVAPSARRGRSLADSIRTGVPPPARPILMHSGNFRTAAVVDRPYKLIWNRDTAFGELYDLAGDPAERRNLLYRDRPGGVGRELATRLQCFLKELPSSRY